MPKKYPLEFKKQAIRRYEKGESILALCQELHISQSTFYHWRNQYRSIQTSAHTYTPAEFDALVRRLQKAEHKLSIIQLSGYLSKVPLQDKLATLEHFNNEMSDLYSVHELCEALDVSRGTFYNHIFRRADRSKYESEKAQLMLKVKQIFDDSEQRYGADKIRTVLAESGLRISAKRVLSIMQELGLHSIRTDAKKVYKNQMRKKQNLLHRKFTTNHPNQVWVSDITYFKIKNAWVYLCAIIDLFSRKVVGYRVSRAASTRLVTTTFRNAYAERGYPQSLTVADGLFCREIDGLFCRSSPDIIVRRRCVLSHKRRGWLQPSPSFRYSRNLALQDELYHPVINNGPAVLVCVDKRLGTGPVNQSRDAG